MSNQQPAPNDSPTIVDVRPDLERGDEPFNRIMEAAQAIQPAGALVIIAPFEPVPLYGVLGANGFRHQTTRVSSDEWHVQFVRGAAPATTAPDETR